MRFPLFRMEFHLLLELSYLNDNFEMSWVHLSYDVQKKASDSRYLALGLLQFPLPHYKLSGRFQGFSLDVSAVIAHPVILCCFHFDKLWISVMFSVF